MLKKVSVQNYERCYPRRLKKFFQSDLNYRNYQNFVPYTSRPVIGNIPHEIIELFEPNERKTKVELFQSVLAKTAQTFRSEENSPQVTEVLNSGIKSIMPEGTQVDIEYIGHGGFKNIYRLGLKDKNNKKIMHDKALIIYNMDYSVYARKSHGVYAEPNS